MSKSLYVAGALVGILLFATASGADADPAAVIAGAETEKVVRQTGPWPLNLLMPNAEDDLDDPAIWVHPTDPDASMIIATDKNREGGGIRLYALDGSEIAFKPLGPINNLSLRYGVQLDGEDIDLLAATNRENKSVLLFRVDARSRSLHQLPGSPIEPRFRNNVYGVCLYRDARAGELFVFVTSTNGHLEQWRLREREGGRLDGTLVRSLELGSQAEGCVADDEYGRVFVAEEDVGIWRLRADPAAEPEITLIDAVGRGRLEDDVEGLTIYNEGTDEGYLIASSQGNSTFAVYERTGDNAFLTSFEVVGPDGKRVQDTDGIVATSRPLGEAFPRGLLVVHDNLSKRGGGSNFKLVPWDAVDSVIRPVIEPTRQ